MYHILFIHSSISGHLGSFCLLTIISNAAINMPVQVFVEHLFFSSLGACNQMSSVFNQCDPTRNCCQMVKRAWGVKDGERETVCWGHRLGSGWKENWALICGVNEVIKRSPGTKQSKSRRTGIVPIKIKIRHILQLRVHSKWPGRRQWMETEESISEWRQVKKSREGSTASGHKSWCFLKKII